MKERIDAMKVAPGAYKAMMALETYVRAAWKPPFWRW
jgi:hypothetical protein